MRLGRFDGGALDFLVEVGLGLVVGLDEAVAAVHQFGDFTRAQIGGHEDDGLREIHAAVVAKGERGLVQHAEEQLPEGVAGFFDFVEEQERKLQLVAVVRRQRFLGDQGMRFAVAKIARRRADQLGDFVGVLEFRAIDFDDGARAAKQNFRRRFHDARFAGARRPEEQQVANRTARGIQSGGEDLEELDERLHALVLPDDLGTQRLLKLDGFRAAYIWI